MPKTVIRPGYVPSLVQLASACDVDRNTITKWRGQGGFPAQEKDGTWCVFAVGLWRGSRDSAPVDGDELLGSGGGGDSPALERYRTARARIAEIDAEIREGQAVDRDVLHETFSLMASVIRDAGATLRRQFGNDAGDILDVAIDSAVEKMDEFLKSANREIAA